MDAFLQLNWNTDINDMVDDVFIKDERILLDSVMYKLMAGTFKDPFGIIRYEEMSKKPQSKTPQKSKKKSKKKKKKGASNKKANKLE